MRVLFLTLYPATAASTRYRVEQFLPELEARGFDCRVAHAVKRLDLPPRRYHLHEARRRVLQILTARRYDVVVVQKALTTLYLGGLDALLRRRARRWVVDIDDATHLGPPLSPRGVARRCVDPGQVAHLLRDADLVLAGNRWLVAETEQLGGKAMYFPTVVDTARFRPADHDTRPFTLGWIGSPSTTPALAPIADVLRDAEQVELIGADPARLGALADKAHRWREEEEVETLQRFAVGLMPLPRDEWTRGKCGLKALQYMACGVPPIVTPYGAALEIVADGVNGLHADAPAEWRAAIARLRDDPEERTRLGAAARETVETRYALSTWAPRLADALERVAS
jgi:glycosyltransferase involved in cell wall biosynthesis